MQVKSVYTAIAAVALCGGVVRMASAAGAVAQRFDQLVDDFVYDTLALSPVSATGQGYHIHKGVNLDDELDDFSPQGMAAQRSLLDDIEARLSKFDAASLDAEQLADAEILRNAIGASRLELDEIQSFRHNPTVYVELVGNALYTPDVLHYAPAPERFRHIIARLKKVPALVRQAEANLNDSPAVWNSVAIEENAGTVALVDTALRQDCPPALAADYAAAAAPAIESLQAFSAWLQATLAGKTSDWRLGKNAVREEVQVRAGHRQDSRAIVGRGRGRSQTDA